MVHPNTTGLAPAPACSGAGQMRLSRRLACAASVLQPLPAHIAHDSLLSKQQCLQEGSPQQWVNPAPCASRALRCLATHAAYRGSSQAAVSPHDVACWPAGVAAQRAGHRTSSSSSRWCAAQGAVMQSAATHAGQASAVQQLPDHLRLQPLPMSSDKDVHILFSFTDQVQWNKVEQPWLQCLPQDEQQSVLATSDVSERKTRLLARALQRAAVSAGVAGRLTSATAAWDQQLSGNTVNRPLPASCDATPQLQSSQPHNPCSLAYGRNTHGKPFLLAPTSQLGHSPATQDSSCSSCPSCTPDLTHVTPPHMTAPLRCSWTPDLGQQLCTTTTTTTTTTSSSNGCIDQLSTAQPVNLPLVQFNLSHTSGIVGCVVGPAHVAVGLDVEVQGRQPRAGVMPLARRRFAAQEVNALAGCTDPTSQARLFSYLWAAKEAFVKARGTGISAAPGLKGFAVGMTPQASSTSPNMLPTALSHLLGTSLNTATQQQDSSHSDLLHITLDLQPGTSTTQPAGCHGTATPSYQLMLMQPSEQHVAALCVALPPGQHALWPAAGSDMSDGAAWQGLRVHVWECVPGQRLRRLPVHLGASEHHDSDVTRDEHARIRVLGCSVARPPPPT